MKVLLYAGTMATVRALADASSKLKVRNCQSFGEAVKR